MKIYPIYLFVLVLSLFSCQENFTKRLERETKLMTERECPKKFDDITVLDSVVFHDDGTNDYKLYYSMNVNSDFKDMFDDKYNEVYQLFLKDVRNDLDLKQIKVNGLNIVYLFREAGSGNLICELRFTKSDYE